MFILIAVRNLPSTTMNLCSIRARGNQKRMEGRTEALTRNLFASNVVHDASPFFNLPKQHEMTHNIVPVSYILAMQDGTLCSLARHSVILFPPDRYLLYVKDSILTTFRAFRRLRVRLFLFLVERRFQGATFRGHCKVLPLLMVDIRGVTVQANVPIKDNMH